MSAPGTNISTEHQPKGSALNPGDTLDRKDDGSALRLGTDDNDQITADIGGVQGADDEKADGADPADGGTAPAPALGEKPDRPAPDAGEIEWSGGLIKKPPSPTV